MKTGRSIVELATEIQRQSDTKKDYVVPTQLLKAEVIDGPGRVALAFTNGHRNILPVAPFAHKQIAERLGIPGRYYERLQNEAPQLLATNINHWLHEQPEKRLVRTLDGNVRAFLSDSYRPLENSDLFEAVFPVIQQLGLQVVSCDVTETRLYIKAVDQRITQDIPKGHALGDGTHTFFDTLSPAVVIRNSEVGDGALVVESSIWTKACTNLAVFERALRKAHLGGKQGVGDEITSLLSDETKRAKDQALWLTVRDVVSGLFAEAQFKALVDRIKGTTQNKIGGSVEKVVEVVAKHFGINDGERDSVLRHLIQGGDLSQYGLYSAVTRAAEDLGEYERSSEFERIGGRIIELPKHDWQRLNVAKELALAA